MPALSRAHGIQIQAGQQTRHALSGVSVPESGISTSGCNRTDLIERTVQFTSGKARDMESGVGTLPT